MTKTKSNLIYTKPVSLVLLLLPKPHKAGYIAPSSHFHLTLQVEKLFLGHIKVISLVAVNMSFIYSNL